ncbi:MAG: Gfo/Idh/MocA family protein, partial [Verrucomicrobiales bacterium]
MRRRQFIAKASTVFAGVNFLPGSAWSQSPNGKLNLIHIGVGGMGGADRGALGKHAKVNVLGLCDIDAGRLEAAKKDSKMAETYSDYREIFEKMGDRIDAAVVSTPDHTHAPASMLALNLGKHVYCQKPLTHDVYEARQVR